MIQLSWNLSFNGDCEAAFKFYEKLLGAKVDVWMTWGETPMAKDVPRDWAKKITHVSMSWNGQTLTGGDAPPGRYEKPQGFYVLLNTTETQDADRLFAALSDNGKVVMPLHETFWAKKFAMVVDRFGTPWMINCGKPR